MERAVQRAFGRSKPGVAPIGVVAIALAILALSCGANAEAVALGAQRVDVMRLVAWETIPMVGTGVASIVVDNFVNAHFFSNRKA